MVPGATSNPHAPENALGATLSLEGDQFGSKEPEMEPPEYAFRLRALFVFAVPEYTNLGRPRNQISNV